MWGVSVRGQAVEDPDRLDGDRLETTRPPALEIETNNQ